MAIMLGALYDALKHAAIPEDAARKAAEEVATYQDRMAAIEARLQLLSWMVGSNIALTLGVLWRLLR